MVFVHCYCVTHTATNFRKEKEQKKEEMIITFEQHKKAIRHKRFLRREDEEKLVNIILNNVPMHVLFVLICSFSFLFFFPDMLIVVFVCACMKWHRSTHTHIKKNKKEKH